MEIPNSNRYKYRRITKGFEPYTVKHDFDSLPEDTKITVIIGEVLLGIWDPIGIKNDPPAFDEYDSYELTIQYFIESFDTINYDYDLLKENISNYLIWVQVSQMGMPTSINIRADNAAQAIIELIKPVLDNKMMDKILR